MMAAFAAELWEQAARFFELRDEAARNGLMGGVLVGAGCGVMGCFLLVRRMALTGDTIAHAVLPGIVLGFAWQMGKDPVALFAGATGAALLAAVWMRALAMTTRLKQDAILGLVLGVSFAAGVVLLTMVQKSGASGQAGLEKFLFGDVVALDAGDLRLILFATGGGLLVTFVCFRVLAVSAFDPVFAGGLGWGQRRVEMLFLFLLVLAIMASVRAVGVVLVSALLIAPGAAAGLVARRFPSMVAWSAVFGSLSAAGGVFLSFLVPKAAAGPMIVLCAIGLFGVVFLFAPERGVVARRMHLLKLHRRELRENLLKWMWGREHGAEVGDFAAAAGVSLAVGRHRARALERAGLAVMEAGQGGRVVLSERGRVEATRVVRRHRLWEMYLATRAGYATDHVHDDAERVEHLLPREVVEELDRRLDAGRLDPHGSRIPPEPEEIADGGAGDVADEGRGGAS